MVFAWHLHGSSPCVFNGPSTIYNIQCNEYVNHFETILLDDDDDDEVYIFDTDKSFPLTVIRRGSLQFAEGEPMAMELW